jgi:rubrerythrin
VALIQNGSWAPASGKLMAQILEGMKNMTVLEAPVTLKSALAQGQEQELDALAQALAASVHGEEPAPAEEPAEAKPRGFVCKICGFIYESDTLPDDFICPICRRPASDFEPLNG